MDQPDPAIGRFWLLQLIRLGGIVMVLTGAMAVAGRLRLTEGQGAVLMVGGAVAFFFLPVLLVKHWKSQE